MSARPSRAARQAFLLGIILGALLLIGNLQAVFAQSTQLPKAEIEKRVDALLVKMNLDEKLTLIGGINDFYIQALPRLGLPALRMSDGPLGVHDYGPTTAYPAGIALAASWDVDLARRVGEMMGKDARARGVHFILAPGMNIYRAPMNGRNFEYLGEDPYLASRLAVSLIEGMQSQGVIATAKHFAVNNQEYGRMDHSSDVDERTLREIYLPAFEAAVKEAKVGALMDAYNLVNGAYMTENNFLNNVIARKEWGFDGIIMWDWGATHDGKAAANGGLDLEMPSALFMNKQTLLPFIQSGEIPTVTIDDKVRRILRKAIQFGFYDREQSDATIPLYSQEGRQLALEEASSGIVLLKNENGILPLEKNKIKSLAVLGPNAYPAVIGGGGSSLTKPFDAISFLEGISNYLGKSVRVDYVIEDLPLDEIVKNTHFVTSPGGPQGLKGEYFNNELLEGAPALVRTAEKIGFRWAEGSYVNDGPLDHFSVRWSGYFIPGAEDDYKFFVSADDGVRLYVNDQRVIDDWQRHGETLDTYSAHLERGKPYKIGLEYFETVGTALAQILFGEINPSGKLPASFERRWEDNAAFDSYYPKKADKHIEYQEGVFLGYRHFDRSKVQPLFAFGYGLSYTTFQYSGLSISPSSADLSAPVNVSFNIKNNGPREGAEIAEIYVGDSHASVPRPVKELKGFAKVHLRPGETKRVTVSLDRRAFSFYDVEKKNWKAEPGKFSILVGSSSEKIERQGEFTLSQ